MRTVCSGRRCLGRVRAVARLVAKGRGEERRATRTTWRANIKLVPMEFSIQ